MRLSRSTNYSFCIECKGRATHYTQRDQRTCTSKLAVSAHLCVRFCIRRDAYHRRSGRCCVKRWMCVLSHPTTVNVRDRGIARLPARTTSIASNAPSTNTFTWMLQFAHTHTHTTSYSMAMYLWSYSRIPYRLLIVVSVVFSRSDWHVTIAREPNNFKRK